MWTIINLLYVMGEVVKTDLMLKDFSLKKGSFMKNLRILVGIFMVLALVSCGSSSKQETTNQTDVVQTAPVTMPEETPVEEIPQALNFEVNSDSDSATAGSLQTIYFAYDSAALSDEAMNVLSANAEFLKQFPTVEVQVEGHCDERGGVQYNLALGEARARSVKDYLVALGVDAVKVTTISFGKERPLAFGHDGLSWGQNRRANFVVTAK